MGTRSANMGSDSHPFPPSKRLEEGKVTGGGACGIASAGMLSGFASALVVSVLFASALLLSTGKKHLQFRALKVLSACSHP